MKKIYLLLYLWMGWMGLAQAQAPVLPPSPNASALGSYGDVPVSLYTGTPGINIPLYTVQSGSLNWSLSLSYRASGIKVGTIASRVGLGWTLQGVGVITRSVQGGINDEYENEHLMREDGSDEKTAVRYGGYLYGDGIPATGPGDQQPDIFYYNFGGYSGKFVMDRQQNIVLLPHNNLQIKHHWGMYRFSPSDIEVPTLTGFEVTTPDGTVYVFDAPEMTAGNLSFEGKTSDIPDYDAMYTLYPGRWYASAWYLTEVRDANGVDTIRFFYEDLGKVSYDLVMSDSKAGDKQGTRTGTCEFLTEAPGTTGSRMYTDHMRRLEKIEFKAGTVTLEAGHLREDFVGDKALTQLHIHDRQGRLIRSFVLDYDYFVSDGDDCDEAACRRLKLQRVTEKTPEVTRPSYVFRYEETHTLPSRHSAEQDAWGYYNQNGASSLIPRLFIYPEEPESIRLLKKPGYTGREVILEGADRSADGEAMQAGILKKIIYPAGGITSFAYEPHRFYFQGDEYEGAGLRIRQITTQESAEAPAQATTYTYTDPEDGNRGSGLLAGMPRYSYVHAVPDVNNTSHWTGWEDYFRGYTIRHSQNQAVLGETRGSRVGYSVVTKTMNQGEGKTVYKYTSLKEYPDEQARLKSSDSLVCASQQDYLGRYDRHPFVPATSYDHRRGLLKERMVYNEAGEVVDSMANQYAFLPRGKLQARVSGTIARETGNDETGLALYQRYGSFAHVSEYVYKTSAETMRTDQDAPARKLYQREEYVLNPLALRVAETRQTGSRTTLRGRTEDRTYMRYMPDYVARPDLLFSYRKLTDWVYALQQTPFVFVEASENTRIKYPGYFLTRRLLSNIIYALWEIDQTPGGDSWTTLLQELNAMRDAVGENAVTLEEDSYYTQLSALHRELREHIPSSVAGEMLYRNILNPALETYYTRTEAGKEPMVVGAQFQHLAMDGDRILPESSWTLENAVPLSLKTTANPRFTPSFPEDDGSFARDSHYTRVWQADRYDPEGKLLTFTGLDGVPQTYVWGYGQTLPVARITGATYAEAEALLGDNLPVAEALPPAQETQLREGLPGAFVTTYTYRPLVGMATQTDANAQTVTYEYDGLGRLETVRDQYGDVVHTREYYEAPRFDAVIRYRTCAGSGFPTDFDAEINPGIQTAPNYTWDFGDGTELQFGKTPSHTYTQPGNYTVRLHITLAGYPPEHISKQVFIPRGMSLAMTCEGPEGCRTPAFCEGGLGENPYGVPVRVTVTGGTGPYQYQWSLKGVNDTAWTALDENFSEILSLSYSSDYRLRCVVTDSCGARKEVSKLIELICEDKEGEE